jgi:putative DNA primase/helicase
MQEPSKDSKINEGVMKELTGGDPVQGRALYCESEIFEPQFKLVVCTNSLFEINSQDDGTWRRIRICDFLSKFIDENEAHTDDTPYVFVKDKTLKERLPILAPIFMSILVKRAFETNGLVEDCDIVKDASNKYRQGQDHITGFVNDKIVKTNNIEDTVKKTDLLLQFKQWFEAEQGNRKQPKGSELYDYMDNKFGKCKKSGFWQGIKILYNSQQDIESNLISDLQNCRL